MQIKITYHKDKLKVTFVYMACSIIIIKKLICYPNNISLHHKIDIGVRLTNKRNQFIL